MRVTASYTDPNDIPPAEIDKTFAAAQARYQLALIQHGCRELEQLPQEARDQLEHLWQESLGELRDRYSKKLGSWWVGDPAKMPDEIRPKA